MYYQHHQPGCVYHLEQQMWKKFTYDWKFIISNGSTYLKYILRSEFRTTLLMAEGLALFWTKNWIRILQKKSNYVPWPLVDCAVYSLQSRYVHKTSLYGRQVKQRFCKLPSANLWKSNTYILRVNSKMKVPIPGKCNTLILPRKVRIHELKLKIWNSDKTYKTGRFVSG